MFHLLVIAHERTTLLPLGLSKNSGFTFSWKSLGREHKLLL